MKKRLYVHIGTHKTGTTSFQDSLGQNRATLAAQGFVPLSQTMREINGETWEDFNCVRLAHSVLRPGVATIARLAWGVYDAVPEKRRTDWAEMRRKAAAAEAAPNLILSAEALSFLRTEVEAAQVAQFFELIGREVVVIVAWRPEAEWRRSWQTQIDKEPWRRQQLAADPNLIPPDGDWYFDPPAIRAFWSRFGPLIEVDYDAAMAAEQNILPALYRAIGASTDELHLDVRHNTTERLPEEVVQPTPPRLSDIAPIRRLRRALGR